jgi:hypothetical protein
MKVCTVSAAYGTCGKPAVASFKGSDGKRYYECSDHAPKATVKAPAPRRVRNRPDGMDVPVGWRIGRDFTE